MHVQTQRVAVPPEPSLAQAQGSTSSSSSSRPMSMPPRPVDAETPIMASRPTDIKPRSADLWRTQPTNPVVFPIPATSHTLDSPPLSPYPDSIEASILPQSSVQDMSYLTRPPRLPLPIEEEVHTPGSPIISPQQDGEPIEDIESLDAEGLTHKSSTLSAHTIDEEDGEELRVDKTRPTVPTRLEWPGGGEKVYVTGTIFQWSRKQRLHPV